MSPCVYFCTNTHNGEKTIERTINSVLNQSYSNLVYFIVDNASTDSTKDIIQRYAKQDSRIHPIYKQENKDIAIFEIIPYILENFPHDGYFALIDQDDEYDPNFLKKMIAFMENENLKIAICSSMFIDATSGEDVSKVILKDKLIIEGEDFQNLLPVYLRFFRDTWAKLYTLNILEAIDYKALDHSLWTSMPSYIAWDSIMRAKKVGICPERLHKYYIYPESMSRKVTLPLRFTLPHMYLYYVDFVTQLCGSVTEKNYQFLSNDYCDHVIDKLSRTPLSILKSERNIETVKTIFTCPFMDIVNLYADPEKISKMKEMESLFL